MVKIVMRWLQTRTFQKNKKRLFANAMKRLLLIFPTLVLLIQCETAPQWDKKSLAQGNLPAMEPIRAAAPEVKTPIADASGVYTTPSGLRYRVLKSGQPEANSPTTFDSVIVHYQGTLIDGTVFDSSYERGSPATFGVSQVIPGWTEALKLMKPGDKWMLHIPAHLAYGSRGAGSKIPPNSDLIFQVELLNVIKGF
jgi:FKBP-type peptidyl-prolyl cis-trans isomerase FklB